MQVVTNTGIMEVDHLHYLVQVDATLLVQVNVTLLGVVIRGIHSHTALIGYKIPLQILTLFIISFEPMVVPPQKFHQQ